MQFDTNLVTLIIYSFVILMSSFGLVGNVISAMVWTRPHMRSSSAIMLTALAACDIVIDLRMLSRAIPGSIVTYGNYTNQNDSALYIFSEDYILPYGRVWVFPIFRMAITASTYLSLLMTLERFVAVCYPFQFREISSQRRTVLAAATVVCLSILFNMSRFWELEVVPKEVGYRSAQLDLMKNDLYILIHRKWLHLIFIYILPFAGIIFLNTAIYIQMMNATRGETLSTLQKNENRLAMMLLYVVLEFFVCSSVTGFLAIWRTFRQYEVHLFGINLNNLLDPLSLFFDTFNASVNFLTYVIFWGPFRRTLKGWLGLGRKDVESPPASPGGLQQSCDTAETVF